MVTQNNDEPEETPVINDDPKIEISEVDSKIHHNSLKNWQWIGLITVLILASLLAWLFILSDTTMPDPSASVNTNEEVIISNYEECVEAGFPVMESYPEQCAVAGGETFTRIIPETDTGDIDYDSNLIKITHNPINLAQTKALSMFRSCEGHDYSGFNTSGIWEEQRSMKHYIDPAPSVDFTVGEVEVFAPFDGYIEQIQPEQTQNGSQVWLKPNIDENPWHFVFFHIDLLPGLKMGSDITGGELIGYADLGNGSYGWDFGLEQFHNQTGFTFNELMQQFMAGELTEYPEEIIRVYDSPFNYMTDEVLAEFAAVGITPDNIVISKADRDKITCTFDTSNLQEWIKLN